MRVELFPFQTKAVNELRGDLAAAVSEYRNRGKSQIVTFAAPTGAGKTIIMISLIEDILFGSDDYVEQQDAIFVWLSDSPQLNNQSKKKFETKSDKIRIGSCVTIDDSFDKPVLEDGNIYFINTQKFGVNSNLTKNGDSRNYTIWQTLITTAREKGDRLYFIIDEAHRGTKEGRDAREAYAIMQRFLLGCPEVGLSSPMPVVIGMSATIERFERLASRTGSVKRSCEVTPEEVRASGLLKDRIIVAHPENNNENVDMTVLQAAVDDWMDKCRHWENYCHNFNVDDVKPILVIQVKPAGNNETISNTDLKACMQTIENQSGIRFGQGEVVHTFSQTSTIRINNLDIQYKDPSDISDDLNVKVVFFKMGLSTGWDCPRAETMMSFSHADDETYIAQLLGRMIRTPLQRRITEDDVLNDVRLFLPFYNHESVDKIINALQDAEGLPTKFENQNIDKKSYDVLTCLQNDEDIVSFNREEVCDFINGLGLLNYRKSNGPTNDYLSRLTKMMHLLSESGLYPDAIKDITRDVVNMICDFIADLKKQNTYEEKVMQVRQLKLEWLTGDVFDGVVDDDNKCRTYSVNSTDIDRQFSFAGKILKDPGFGTAYGTKLMEEEPDFFEEDLDAFKIDVILFSNDHQCLGALYSYAKDKFNTLYNDYRGQFNVIASSNFRDRFTLLSPESDGFIVPTFELPRTIQVAYESGGDEYSDHLFVNEETGIATFKFDGWEKQTLEEERRRSDFVCWIRNPSRSQWALAIKCVDGSEKKLLYPDFLIVRKINGNYVVDILEPHTDANADNLYKAKGLAEYAKDNPRLGGRVQLIRMGNRDGAQRLIRLDMSKVQVREAVQNLIDVNGLNDLFTRFGESES